MAISPSGSLLDIYSNPQSFQYQSKNLKYDKDIRGGGYSGQPWIKRIAPDSIDNLNSLTSQALSLDYPIRGGSYEEIAAREDFARIDRFLLSYPGGQAFLDKQAGLMLSNPRMPMAQSGGLFANQAYSDGRNLMTQIADAGTGIRNPNAGIDINVLERFENKYEYVTATTPTNENRLVLLKDLKLSQPPPSTISSINQIGTIANNLLGTIQSLVNDAPSISPTVSSTQLNVATKLGINTVTSGELFNYTGGPGSLYGIVNNTLILKATNSKNAFIDTSRAQRWIGGFGEEDTRTSITKNIYGEQVQGRPLVNLALSKHLGVSIKYNLTEPLIGINANDDTETLFQQSGDGFVRAEDASNQPANGTIFKYTMGYDTLVNQPIDLPRRTTNDLRPVVDFRKTVMDPSSVQSRDYTNSNVNITTRVGIGDPGSRPENLRINPDSPYRSGQDSINMKDVVKNVGASLFNKDNGTRDLIKFSFETILNQNTNLVNATHFRAYLTGYNDSHSAEWSAKRYSGRGENFYTYQGVDRDVSFNFKVAAQSKQEMKFLYRKLNYLLSTLYPDYSSAGSMRGNITKLTIGDLFVRQAGVLTSLNLTVADDYPWEIAFQENVAAGGAGELVNEDLKMLEVPQIIDVAVSFKPILNVLPQTGFDIDSGNNKQSPILIASQGSSANKFLGNT
tara:strand:+ start:337 stop:2370 length:2034 start_codon:yes stop_codon:yes gene_type:complete